MSNAKKFTKLGFTFLILYIIAVGAYLRLVGLDWDEEQHLHPDERFLTMVESSIAPVESLGDYFNTAESSLNPHNRGHGFFVYGTLPIFIVRYVAEWMGETGYGQVYLIGRALSALADLGVIALVYLMATRLYDRRVGVLGAAFYAFAVLPIQQSHFFTVDTFNNFFTFLALYFAVEVAIPDGRGETVDGEIPSGSPAPGLLSYLLFGLALGMAVASKINALPVALALPGAALLYLLRLSPEEQHRQFGRVAVYVVLAGVVSIVAFRVFQPYAFSGPGFFGLKPNPQWVENMTSLRAQTAGDVDFPPALQWARRPAWFSWQNLTLWGLGLPLGLLAWAGFLWMGWRVFKGERRHVLLWGWTAFYFVWQSIQWNSTMRYQLPIYPALAIIAAWVLYQIANYKLKVNKPSIFNRQRVIALFLGSIILLLTFAWAFAFSRIYTVPHTRVEASRWMMQNFSGPITLAITGDAQGYSQPLPFSQGTEIRADQPYQTSFIAQQSGLLTEIELPHVADVSSVGNLLVSVTKASSSDQPMGVVTIPSVDMPSPLQDSGDFEITFDHEIIIASGIPYSITFEVLGDLEVVDFCAPHRIAIQGVEGIVEQELKNTPDCFARFGEPYSVVFVAETNGSLFGLTMEQADAQLAVSQNEKTLHVALSLLPEGDPAATAQVTSAFAQENNYRGESFALALDAPVDLTEDNTYYLTFSLEGNGALAFSGAAPANESTWDDGLPLRMDGYDPYGGIYQGGLSFEMYWEDNEEKLERFTGTLGRADFVLITSSRQWGTTTRVPERYPLTSAYYRNLLGCPAEQNIEWCYNVAQPGMFQGRLGFELVQVFQSNPSLGNFEINDQFAEEAFTVYDHPKVFVFQKTADYDPDAVAQILGAVDLSKVIHVTPRKADSFPGNLMLPSDRLAEQRAGGTWSELFNTDALYNRFQPLGVALWYLSVFVLGLIAYPLVRFALPGLSDRGYPLARISGLLLLAYLVWIAGSARIPFTRATIGVAILLMALLGGWLAYRQRDDLLAEWRERRSYFLTVEGLFLIFFLVMLLIRLGNPDLWHPWKGGEKPMDFSYFNAVLKSTSFPPYDPWFAGGYINYYYYGFVLVGVLTKFLGIVPAFAYNLILPTLFALVAMGAFSIVWNLFGTGDRSLETKKKPVFGLRSGVSLAGALAMAVLGNLGILRMLFEGYQRLIVSTDEIRTAGLFQKVGWFFQGFLKTFSGSPLPYRLDEWYWNPSRVIGAEHGNPITEFPFFTFLYADLHAHMIALPIALLVVAWALAVVLGKAWSRQGGRSPLQISLSLLLGGLTIGAMYPVNLSDIYTYLPLGVVAAAYAVWRYWKLPDDAYAAIKRFGLVVAVIAGLWALSTNLYEPYTHWYSQGYNRVGIWPGTNTPLADYLTHWGLFLFAIVSWMFVETVDWMAKTPLSALRKLAPHRGWIWGGLLALLVVILSLSIDLPLGEKPLPFGLGVHITGLVLPLAVWAAVLLFRPNMPDHKRFVLFLVGTALMLSLMVEIVSVEGDIGRMNTVFKFYLQAWGFFAVSAAAAFGWLLADLPRWGARRRLIWQIAFVFLAAVAGLYPILGSFAKIEDRMAMDAPHTLDGMAYMQYATYYDEGAELDLSEDYAAIRWMQENIVGSPVIVEANQVEYHWGTRYTIYTGLPGVVGWNWHMRQQRTVIPHDWVYERVDGVQEFYTTDDIAWAVDFLQRYEVSYIMLGQFERAKYDGPGLEKFQAYEGQLWSAVFREGDTEIYQVMDK